jgi:hypothetical protein
VLDGGGDQVAYVQTVGGIASLVLLRMANSGSTVEQLSAVAATSYHGCTAPCYTALSLGTTDSNSAPFYNYSNDSLYVGDDAGNVHQFTTVFGGTPTAGWTTKVTGAETATVLTGPVVDPNTGTIFVADSAGYLHSLNASGGALATSNHMGFGTYGITDAPLIDSSSTTSYVYALISYGGDTGNHAYVNIFDASTSISASYGESYHILGPGNSSLKLYDGAFDNQHTTATNGNFYVCGGDPTNGTNPTLYQLPLGTGPAVTAVNTYNSTANGAGTCSPVSEFYDGTHDWVYLSVTANGNQTGCTGACLYNYSIPTSGTATSGAASAGLAVTGGSGGIVIDNNSTTPTNASEIYFNSLAQESCNGSTTGCAVQASQSNP